MPFTLLFRLFHDQIKFVAAIALAQELNKKVRAGRRMAVFESKYVLRSGRGPSQEKGAGAAAEPSEMS